MRSPSRSEAGSVMVLVPVGFLILMLLAALAVDGAVAYLGQRQLTDALTAAANDAATAGLDDTTFYRDGAVTLDPGAAGTAACRSLSSQEDLTLHDLQVSMSVDGPTIELQAQARVEAVFGRWIPGLATRTVRAMVSADAEQGPGPPTAGGTPPVSLAC